MNIKVAITALLTCLTATATAQTFTEHLQDKQTKGTVTVTHSKDIDDLVNGKKGNTTHNGPTVTPITRNDKAQAGGKNTHTTDTARNNAATTDHTRKATDTSLPDDMEIPTIDTRKKVMRNSRKVTGYRVQAFAGGNSRTDRSKAQAVGNKIKSNFPDIPVYVHFYSPRWICRVGNFRTYEEAAEMLKEVKKLGYQSACIVKGKITVQY